MYFGLRDEDPEQAKARKAAAQAWERPSLGRIAIGLATLAASFFFCALLWRTLDGGDTSLESVTRLAVHVLVFGVVGSGATWLIHRRRDWATSPGVRCCSSVPAGPAARLPVARRGTLVGLPASAPRMPVRSGGLASVIAATAIADAPRRVHGGISMAARPDPTRRH